MKWPLAYLGFTASQVPQVPMHLPSTGGGIQKTDFAVKGGPDVFSPKNLVRRWCPCLWIQRIDFGSISGRTWAPWRGNCESKWEPCLGVL